MTPEVMNVKDQSTVRVFWQDLIEVRLVLAAIGAWTCVGHTTLRLLEKERLVSNAKPGCISPFSLDMFVP